jgi:RimJ/RimL family protein N-acetyltransferase
MQFLLLDSPERIRLVASWLMQKENYQWLDFGDGRQQVSAPWLKVAMQRGSDVLRIFTADDDETPIGVVGFSNVNPHFKTANIWVVLGDKSQSGRGYASRATSEMLTLGFVGLNLRAVYTWIVEHNPSIRVAERVRFRPIGRQRKCHHIDGRAYDRLWFDLLASEHEEVLDVERRRTA